MKHADKIIEAVFDGGAEDLSALQAGLDEKGRAEVQALSLLRDDLRSLKAVPECQVTSERLRNAILNRPARPAQSSPWWVWAPVGAIALVAVGLVNRQPAEIASVVRREAAGPVADGRPSRPDPVRDSVPGDAVRSQPPVAPETATAVNSEPSAPARSRHPVSSEGRVSAQASKLLATALGGSDGPPAAGLEPGVGGDAAASRLETAESGTGDPGSPVVVVTDTPSPMTGAAEAHEVSRPSDMVFGG